MKDVPLTDVPFDLTALDKLPRDQREVVIIAEPERQWPTDMPPLVLPDDGRPATVQVSAAHLARLLLAVVGSPDAMRAIGALPSAPMYRRAHNLILEFNAEVERRGS